MFAAPRKIIHSVGAPGLDNQKDRTQKRVRLRSVDDLADRQLRSRQPQAQAELKLDLHPKKIVIKSWRQGIDFVGYVHKPWTVVVRTETKNRMLKKVSAKNLTSYFGVAKHADSYKLIQNLKNIASHSGQGA